VIYLALYNFNTVCYWLNSTSFRWITSSPLFYTCFSHRLFRFQVKCVIVFNIYGSTFLHNNEKSKL